jgi:hypothetical protein
VDNHADGPYVYLRMLREDPERAKEVLKLLKWNEGNSSGRGIGCVSWDGSGAPGPVLASPVILFETVARQIIIKWGSVKFNYLI